MASTLRRRRADVVTLYDVSFFRMWEFYLATSEPAFGHDRLFIFQLRLARHQDVVPYERNYVTSKDGI